MRTFRPSLQAATWLCNLLNEALNERFIDRVWRPEQHQLLVRFSGRDKRRLLLTVHPQHISASLTYDWGQTPSQPDQTTIRFREALEGARVKGCELSEQRGLTIRLSRKGEALSLRQQLAGRFPNLEVIGPEGLNVRLLTNRPGSDPESPTLPDTPDDPTHEVLSAWDEAVQSHLVALRLELAKSTWRRQAKGWLKRRQRAVKQLERDAARASRSTDDLRFGELLKTMLGRIPPGATSIDAVDYTTPEFETVSVPLDPAIDGQANMERFFKRYRKFHDALDSIKVRLEAARRSRDDAQRLVQELEDAKDPTHVDQLGKALRALGWRPPAAPQPKQTKKAPLPYRRFIALDGSEIWVGKGAKHNDTLTFHHAKGNDIWLHARDAAGAHVILRRQGSSGDIHPEALIDAAVLAKLHSKAKNEGFGDVMWTERKHVRKAKGAPNGQVSVAKSRHLTVNHDQPRLERLYKGERLED